MTANIITIAVIEILATTLMRSEPKIMNPNNITMSDSWLIFFDLSKKAAKNACPKMARILEPASTNPIVVLLNPLSNKNTDANPTIAQVIE